MNSFNHGQSPAKLSLSDYTVGWVCALHIEMAAAQAMLDEVHESLPNSPFDSNTYILGRMGRHNVVIACLPTDGYGIANAANVGTNMNRSFPSICWRLMVGVGGGVPGKVDVRLGDIVVGKRTEQYDLGKTVQDGRFQRMPISQKPPYKLRTAVTKLRAHHESEPSMLPTILSDMFKRYPSMTRYTHPGIFQDRLFHSSYDHDNSMVSCESCDTSKLVERPARTATDPKIHYGGIASGNQVMKDGKTRDQLAAELDVICFEMEAAGLMDNFPCLVIRGICDYSDSHKNKRWQEYAAATAAAYAKELLSIVSADEIRQPLMAEMSTITDEVSPEDRRKARLDSLKFERIDSRYSSIEEAHVKTCEWLLETPEYRNWLDRDKFVQHHGFLWINGKPGAGKSTLMKFAFTCANNKAANYTATVSFFFNARGGELEKSTVGMYRSLLHQLLIRMPDLQKLLDNPDLCPQSRSGLPTWDIQTLRHLFSDATAKLGQRQLICFIDALDECNELQVEDMVDNFEDLGQCAVATGTQLYICFSSRPYPSIRVQYGWELILEHQIGHAHDLKRYVRSKLRIEEGEFADKVRTKILQKAGGIFMWVVLVVDILNKEFKRGRIFAVEKRLQEIPSKLSDLFKDILTRDEENMADFLLCIQWTLYAKQPLKPEEFYFAVVSGLDPDPKTLAKLDPTPDVIRRFILSSSKGLAEITDSTQKTVQFIHESVRDFLIKDGALRDLWAEYGEDFESLSHDRLKKCCQTYMQIDISDCVRLGKSLPSASSKRAEPLQNLVSKYPFLRYATNHVLYHADAAANEVPQDDFLEGFPLEAWINLHNIFTEHRHHTPINLLYILAERNTPRLIRTLRRHNPRINIRGGLYKYPFFVALINRHRDAVRALLQQETSTLPVDDIALLKYRWVTNSWNQTPISWAIKEGYTTLATVWIEAREFDVDSKGESGQTPLSFAAEGGHEAVVKLLLATGQVDVDSKDNDTRTSLSRAAEGGHEAVVKLLLTTGQVDVNSKDYGIRTPLSWAAEVGHEAVVKLLLATSQVDVNSEDRYTRTPLSYAAVGGHEAVVKLLLATGQVDVDSKDRFARTPLLYAVVGGHEAVVKLLLATGQINVDSGDMYGNTPLSKANEYNREAIVKLLLSAGQVDIDSKDEDGWTLLWWATR